jgi:hypothetical protein
MSDRYELDGLTFSVEVQNDGDPREPWKESDGHGVVSEWTRRDKAPGERVMCEDRWIQAVLRLRRRRGDCPQGWMGSG